MLCLFLFTKIRHQALSFFIVNKKEINCKMDNRNNGIDNIAKSNSYIESKLRTIPHPHPKTSQTEG